MNKKQITTLKRFMPSKKTMPILHTIKIESGTATATNLDITLLIEGVETNLAPGCYAPAKVEASLNGATVQPDYPVEEFPPLQGLRDQDEEAKIERVKLPGSWLEDLESCAMFSSNDESRFQINGVCYLGGKMIATNGRVLIFRDSGLTVPHQVTIPRGTIKALKGFRPERMEFTPSAAAIKGDGWTVFSKLIEGKFPDYTQVIPRKEDVYLWDGRLTIPDFPVKVLSPTKGANGSGMVLRINQGQPGMVLRDKDNGIDYPLGDSDLKIGCNACFLELARNFTDHVLVRDETSPLVYLSESVQLVFMPIRPER